MPLKIKNWERFQHFKDRKPPWIKLYRDLLDDRNWHILADSSAKLLVSLWLLASEDETQQGKLPSLEEIAFRLRTDVRSIKSRISKLNHWLVQDDINPISDIGAISQEHQEDINTIALARSRETETETETDSAFAVFWRAYPSKVGKGAAETAWRKAHINGDLEKILAAIDVQRKSQRWTKDGGQFIPNPATWINQRRWEDEFPKHQDPDRNPDGTLKLVI